MAAELWKEHKKRAIVINDNTTFSSLDGYKGSQSGRISTLEHLVRVPVPGTNPGGESLHMLWTLVEG